MNITFETIKAAHGDKATGIWNAVCDLGGFGRIEPNHSGGLDCTGLPAKTQAEIAALVAGPKGKENK